MLDDPVGAALALNRLAISFHKFGRHEKSLLLHKKHLSCSDSDNSFAAMYNIGIAYRILGKYSMSLDIFHKAKK